MSRLLLLPSIVFLYCLQSVAQPALTAGQQDYIRSVLLRAAFPPNTAGKAPAVEDVFAHRFGLNQDELTSFRGFVEEFRSAELARNNQAKGLWAVSSDESPVLQLGLSDLRSQQQTQVGQLAARLVAMLRPEVADRLRQFAAAVDELNRTRRISK